MSLFIFSFNCHHFFTFVGDESNHVDFSPADMKLSVQELKLQDGDQLIAVDRSLMYVLENIEEI